jgi:hypothetical protein
MAGCVRSRPVLRTLLKLRRCAEGSTACFFPTGWVPQQNHNFISKRLT